MCKCWIVLQYFTLLSLIHSESSIDVENNERCIINSITVMQMNAFPSILNLNKKYCKPKKKEILKVINLRKPTTPIKSLGTFSSSYLVSRSTTKIGASTFFQSEKVIFILSLEYFLPDSLFDMDGMIHNHHSSVVSLWPENVNGNQYLHLIGIRPD